MIPCLMVYIVLIYLENFNLCCFLFTHFDVVYIEKEILPCLVFSRIFLSTLVYIGLFIVLIC